MKLIQSSLNIRDLQSVMMSRCMVKLCVIRIFCSIISAASISDIEELTNFDIQMMEEDIEALIATNNGLFVAGGNVSINLFLFRMIYFCKLGLDSVPCLCYIFYQQEFSQHFWSHALNLFLRFFCSSTIRFKYAKRNYLISKNAYFLFGTQHS